jgi:CarboxypepD_reg-like domain
MRVYILLIFACYFSTLACSQNAISGYVLDKNTHKPIEIATVYVDGSTIGTMTDSKGHFTIKGISFPCHLVVSHLGYETKMTVMDSASLNDCSIFVKEKSISLAEVSIIDKSTREALINLFKSNFLGDDKWGKGAILLNDSTLTFMRDSALINTEAKPNFKNRHLKWSADSLYFIDVVEIINVKAREQLIVDLPLLGYILQIDLVSFSYFKKNFNTICQFLGYFYFKPYNNVNEKNAAKYERKRQETFYNSSQHFCRSLFKKDLKNNGFVTSERKVDEGGEEIGEYTINLDSAIKYDNDNCIIIDGLNNIKYNIYYVGKSNGKPISLINKKKLEVGSDIEKWKNSNYYLFTDQISTITFLNDTCTIRSNGTIPDNNITFGGKIAEKKVGAMVPDDYEPEKYTTSAQHRVIQQ